MRNCWRQLWVQTKKGIHTMPHGMIQNTLQLCQLLSICHQFIMYILSREYTCAETSRALNKAASACWDALVCMANFGTHEHPWFASCAAWPGPSAVGPFMRAPAEARLIHAQCLRNFWSVFASERIQSHAISYFQSLQRTAQFGSAVSMPHLSSIRLHFLFWGNSHRGAAHRGGLLRCTVCLGASVFPALKNNFLPTIFQVTKTVEWETHVFSIFNLSLHLIKKVLPSVVGQTWCDRQMMAERR